ncbi:phosphopantetheine-binding protein [Streptomyces sp. NPDC058372]|uniref:phosphopantetheine-binding protein n=1 Tax=Streptomyces sp. NPDC058372 TaxID=3346464 RepID=UPI003664992E
MEWGPQRHRQGGRDEASESRTEPSNAPVGLVQEIAELWGEYLNGGDVGAEDDFFTLGGNSLIGIKIIDRVYQDYGVELSVRAFYLAQTPARVAGLVHQGRALT